jgi:hypothetical protein
MDNLKIILRDLKSFLFHSYMHIAMKHEDASHLAIKLNIKIKIIPTVFLFMLNTTKYMCFKKTFYIILIRFLKL